MVLFLLPKHDRPAKKTNKEFSKKNWIFISERKRLIYQTAHLHTPPTNQGTALKQNQGYLVVKRK